MVRREADRPRASSPDRPAGESPATAEVATLLGRLPAGLRTRIDRIAAAADRHGTPVYLVGGFVRDLLLGREDNDLDVVIEGDGLAFARRLAAEIGGRLTEHPAFLTAVVDEPEGLHVDVATARSETYRAPAALPEVQPASLRQDLFRRDFTVNTLAIRLGRLGQTPTELIDPFDGLCDLRAGTLRILHDRSFEDDPTRILRGVRLERRLGFRLTPATERLVAPSREVAFDRLSGSRLREELALLLGDAEIAVSGLERLGELGLLAALHPRLAWTALVGERLQRAQRALDGFRQAGEPGPPVVTWRLFALALAADLADGEREALADRLLLAGEDRRLLTGFPARLAAARAVIARREAAPHEVERALSPLAGEELLLLVAEMDEMDETGAAWVRRHRTELLPLRLSIRGADLVAAGLPPGPAVGHALAATRQARLDGRIGPDEELAHALAFDADRKPEPAVAGGGVGGGEDSEPAVAAASHGSRR